MNIFVLDANPIIAAQLACDKHVVKMPLETAQMLCSAFPIAPYKKTHYNHPCTAWSRANISNYTWLIEYGLALCAEYTYRYNKTHKSEEVIKWCRDNSSQLNLPNNPLLPFVTCMPDEFIVLNDPITSYRQFYKLDKVRFAKWTNRDKPIWMKNSST